MCDVGGGASVECIPGRIPGTRCSELMREYIYTPTDQIT
jgi:hypothetical protein